MKETIEVKNNIHANHRQRLKSKFINSGLDNFAEHEILELLLFYSIPQADTNPTAHALIQKFGSIQNVFDASADSLMTVPGIGEHSALLIKLVPAIMHAYSCQLTKKYKVINNQLLAMDFVRFLFNGISNEEFYIIALSAKNEVLETKSISKGDKNKVDVEIRTVSSFILQNGCKKVILAHNHPTTDSSPSPDDITMTQKLFYNCVLNDVDIVDHIIYSQSGCFSFAENNIMMEIKKNVLSALNFEESSITYKRFSTSTKEYVIKKRNNE